jgi:FAD/FMN-containing dehydrogenase
LEEVKKAADGVGIEIVAFGHAGDGHLHVNALVDTTDPELAQKLKQLLLDTTEIIARLGGTTCGEHGDGRLRAGTLEAIYGREIIDLFTRVKRAFDPHNIMNPGVILPDARSPVADLKVGDNVEEIPDTIAALLRKVERNAGWGSPLDWSF